ncbi:MAG: S8 family serine peptidase, partial [Candidatus Altiarchaeota archaeon]|nr:S8 family serine peptidase [Candidatus Altiarchaeota archaeon]
MIRPIKYLFIFLLFFSPVIAGGIEKGGESNGPIINPEIIEALNLEQKVPVLIKLRYGSDGPFISRMATSSDPSLFISKEHIKSLQLRLEQSFSSEELEYDIEIIHRLDNIPWITGNITQRALKKLQTNPNVAMIVEDRHVKAFLSESGPLINRDGAHSLGYTGSGVTVAVFDTGIDTDHPNLWNNLIWEECFLHGGCPITGGTRASGLGSAEDGNGHGTHVSGIITSSNTIYKGVAPDADIVAIKVLDDAGNGRVSDEIAAIDWVTSNNDTYGIKIINLSLGSGAFSGTCDSINTAEAAVAEAAKSAGITLFSASGNEAYNSQMSSPACISSVISVGMVYDANVGDIIWGDPEVCSDYMTWADKIACVSNVSSVMDLLAPGAMITSSYIGGGNNSLGGTSQASPHAAAVAALLLQKNSALSPDDIANILKNTGMSIFDSRIGLSFPRIDALSALNAIIATSPVYRFWSDTYRSHFFTINEEEKDFVKTLPEWTFEGIAWYASTAQQSGTLPVYRFWSDTYRSHFFTISKEEKDIVETLPEWTFEGIAWYASTAQQSGT